MKANDDFDDRSIFTRKNMALIFLLVLVAAGAWYAFSRYQQNSGGALKNEIAAERQQWMNDMRNANYNAAITQLDLTAEQRKKLEAAPVDQRQQLMNDMRNANYNAALAQLNLTAEQREKLEAAPIDQRQQILNESLTTEQRKKLGELIPAGNNPRKTMFSGFNPADAKAIQDRLKNGRAGGGGGGGRAP